MPWVLPINRSGEERHAFSSGAEGPFALLGDCPVVALIVAPLVLFCLAEDVAFICSADVPE